MVSTAAAQLGLLAACVVLFLPMGLAGLHVSRNKVLFFGGALFISLALIVHLSPLLLGPTTSFSSSSDPTTTTLGPTFLLSCFHSSLRFFFVDPTAPSFSPIPSSSCGAHFKILSRTHSLSLLNGTTIVFAGDSQSRLLLLSLLRLLLHPSALDSASSDLFLRHSDYHTLIPSHSISLHFLWSPFESNISSALKTLENQEDRHPDLLVAGSGLWHMLHVTNATDYGEKLTKIRSSGVEIRSHMFWVGLPMLVEALLNTEEKRMRMNRTVVDQYEKEVERSGILRRDGGPFSLLDVGLLSRQCGVRCTEDGMHYDKVVYDAAVQVMMNALVIQSEQRI